MTLHGSWTVDRLVEAYTQHQRRTRGLRPQTLRNRSWFVRRLVRAALGADPLDPATQIPPADLLPARARRATPYPMGIPVKWNSVSGDLEHGFRRSGTLVGA